MGRAGQSDHFFFRAAAAEPGTSHAQATHRLLVKCCRNDRFYKQISVFACSHDPHKFRNVVKISGFIHDFGFLCVPMKPRNLDMLQKTQGFTMVWPPDLARQAARWRRPSRPVTTSFFSSWAGFLAQSDDFFFLASRGLRSDDFFFWRAGPGKVTTSFFWRPNKKEVVTK